MNSEVGFCANYRLKKLFLHASGKGKNNNMFGKTRHIHIIGIGGAGLSGIAEILFDHGFHVTGSDISKSDTTEHLRDIGVTVFYGHDAAQIRGADVIVISPAIPPDNSELLAAQTQKNPNRQGCRDAQ